MTLRIALIHAGPLPDRGMDGSARLVAELSEFLRGSGHVVDTCIGTGGESEFRVGTSGRSYRLRIPHIRALDGYGLGPSETFGARVLLPLLVHRYDAVHTFSSAAALASVIAGQPTVYTPTENVSNASDLHRVGRVALSRAVSSSTEVAALSSDGARSIEASFGRRASIVQPGLFVDRWAPLLGERSEAPRIIAITDLGSHFRGVAVLLAAFERLLEQYPSARLSLRGPRKAERALREVTSVTSENIWSSIDFTQSIGADEYRSAHVTVLPSRDEPSASTLIESLACGTPVVGIARGAGEDIVCNAEVGSIVSGDSESLAEGLAACIALAADPDTGSRCRVHAGRWDWSKVGDQYELLYTKVSSPRGRLGGPFLQAAIAKLTKGRTGGQRE